MENTGER